MRASSLARDGGGGTAYLARLRLAMRDEPVSVGGAGCLLAFVGFGAVAGEQGEGGVEGCCCCCCCCLDFEERGRRMERERKRLNPVRFVVGCCCCCSDGMGGMGMCVYIVGSLEAGGGAGDDGEISTAERWRR